MDLCKYQKLFNENKIPVARTDLAGSYLAVNKAYEELIGYSLQELKQLTYDDITPEKCQIFERDVVFKTVFAIGEAKYEKTYIHKSGKIIQVQAHVFVINDSSDGSGMWGTFELIS